MSSVLSSCQQKGSPASPSACPGYFTCCHTPLASSSCCFSSFFPHPLSSETCRGKQITNINEPDEAHEKLSRTHSALTVSNCACAFLINLFYPHRRVPLGPGSQHLPKRKISPFPQHGVAHEEYKKQLISRKNN